MARSCILLLLVVHVLHLARAEEIKVSFINFSSKDVELFWFDESSQSEVAVDTLVPYLETSHSSSLGHTFVYYFRNERHTVSIQSEHEIHAIGYDAVQVQCSTSTGDVRIVVKPDWSPLGAGRFLELVNRNYFDGCGLNRVVKEFLTQFGISADYELRTEYRTAMIKDDVPKGIDFRPGYMSYAGSGPDSRSNEIFIVMPDTGEEQLAYFGSENPWETPFGYVKPESLSTVAQWYEYGDMPPWGTGPDPERIYEEDGYEYLKKEFPNLSYIHECRILSSDSADVTFEEL
jgi:peptidyl-prolyl cis-trans isomerase A (cyclophilin A)